MVLYQPTDIQLQLKNKYGDKYKNNEPYKPDTEDSLLALCGISLYCIALVVLIIVLFGCSNPVSDRDNLTVQRPCSDCHTIQNGVILDERCE